MNRIGLCLALLLSLAACTPAQMCRYEATRDLNALDQQIADTSADIARGYRLVLIDEPYWPDYPSCHNLKKGEAKPAFCPEERKPRYRRESINIEAERAKLASLESQRDRMIPLVNAALAACPQD